MGRKGRSSLSHTPAIAPPPIKRRRTGAETSDDTRADSEVELQHPARNGDTDHDMSSADGKTPAADAIDEDLYSRQLYVLGHEAMTRMQRANVLFVGMRGLGVEIVKSVVLQGVKSVALWDPSPATLDDLSAQFFLSEADIGKPRAEACVAKIAELNNYVPCKVVSDSPLDADLVKEFAVVVCTDQTQERQLELNRLCRENNVAFISTSTHGVFASVFCDFGEKFKVVDTNGERAHEQLIASITQSNPATVTVNDEQRFPLESGQKVVFSEIEGMTELNDGKPREVKITGPYTFELVDCDSTNFGAHVNGGQVLEVKPTEEVSFLSLAESLEKPEHVVADWAKMDQMAWSHIAFQALHAFVQADGEMPRAHNAADAEKVIELAKGINAGLPEGALAKVEWGEGAEKHVRRVAFQARGQLANVIAAVGGLVAQEVQKACSGKFMPIRQFWYFDAVEMLPEGFDQIDEAEFAPTDDRYTAQVASIGRKLHQDVRDLNYFLVGAGAIGCEVLKIWAMMGVATGEKGKIDVTDMDIIEKSNLNRQFLFRPKDVGSKKSTTAVNAVQVMNPQLNGKVSSHSTRVGPETEDVFDSAFYGRLSGVCNALDNVQARLYMDQQCIIHGKSLLESGTLGTKGNTQVVIPHLTESYGSSRDAPEKSIPMCTLHHFPNNITHTIQWGRDVFEGLFRSQIESSNAFLADPSHFLSSLESQSVGSRLETLGHVHSCLIEDAPKTFDDCIVWGRLKFEEFFANNIKQLLFNFPKDMVQKDTGSPFWSGPKRAPDPLQFDIANQDHLNFVFSAANLRAQTFGITQDRDISVVQKVAPTTKIPDFVPKGGMKIEEEKEGGQKEALSGAAEAADSANEDDKKVELFQEALQKLDVAQIEKLQPVEFEKDDDSNFHMDFITAVANLRATNYSIEPTTKHVAKGIAGKIIPAMVTTTSVVSGLVCIELLKLIQAADPKAGPDAPGKKLEDFSNGFLNLAIPFTGFSDPIAAPSFEIREGWSWTLWDRLDVEGDGKELTLQEFIDWFSSKHQLEVSMISHGTSLLYSSFMAAEKRKERLPAPLSEVIASVTKNPLPEGEIWTHLECIVCREEDDEDVDIPSVRYRYSYN